MPHRYANRMKESDIEELCEAIEIGMECDPTPITVADLTKIFNDTGPDIVTIHQMGTAMRKLVERGILEQDVMFCQKRQCTVIHYFHVEWDGRSK